MILAENHHLLLNGNSNISDIYSQNSDEYYMYSAIETAKLSRLYDEVPIGSIIVCNSTGNIISSAHNQTITRQQTCSHAEILAITKACDYFKNYRLPNCSIYSTLEPCAMCAGAIIHARLSRLIFGAWDYKTGMCGSILNLFENKTNHHTTIKSGVLEQECKELLQSFFKQKRINKKLNKIK